MEQKKHLCKYCHKSFLNGRVLGGHMRAHLAMNSDKVEAQPNMDLLQYGSGTDECTSYVLRENPKKSWKFASVNHGVACSTIEEFVCGACGKEFQSQKSLFGHLRHHSGRAKKAFCCKECGKGYESAKSLSNHARAHCKSKLRSRPNLVLGRLSDSETVSLVRKKRSSRMRYKIISTSSSSSLNESSYVTEIDPDIEETAISLIMLSRDVHNWCGFDSVNIYSKSDSQTMWAGDEGEDFVRGKKQRMEKLDSRVLGTDNLLCEKKVFQCSKFDSMIESDEEMKDGLTDGRRVGLKMPELAGESENDEEIYGAMEKNPNEVKSRDDLMVEVGRLDLSGSDSLNSISTKKVQLDASDSEMGETLFKKMTGTTSDSFKCKTCNKIFHSYQALGGHQTGHRMNKTRIALNIDDNESDVKANIGTEAQASCRLLKLENNNSSAEQEAPGVSITSAEPKESIEHKCPICFKIFVSGRALGGHKRAHASKISETRGELHAIVVKQELSDASNTSNPNSPVMHDVQAHSESDFKPWWTGDDCGYGPALGVIAD